MKILIADPAKNITVFVLDPVESPPGRAALARAILAEKSIGAEQVGFVVPGAAFPNTAAGPGLWRLEMAGGEFCGNAARSFGFYVAMVLGLKGKTTLFVSVSGADGPVRVEVDAEKSRASAEMPKPLAVKTLDYEGRALPVLIFEGITHIIAPDLEAKSETFYAIKSLAEREFFSPNGLLEKALPSAVGVMFYDTASRFTRPAVYVRGVDSLVFESSCGSGSAALGVWLSRELCDGVAGCLLTQPGGVIETEVTKRAGEISAISIGGEVILNEPREFSW